ncbi:MAG: glycosyltransferase family 39 protein [Candidatus Omnitrophica bacterium]|nr:glycosyltransferase family 39 protein [Candidatus Omnitrophota bacterium]
MTTEDRSLTHLFYARCLAGVCLCIHLMSSLIGWNNSLLDHHGFRQTQTAITSYYFIKDGFKLNYETPVFGVPWSIPFEFPLYQGVVALIVKATGWGLDQTGRGVSLFFFYAMLMVLYRLVIALSGSRVCAWFAVAFSLSSPLYIFWSRTFLMESMALFFGILYLWSIVESHKNKSFYWLLLAMSAGSLSGLVKITTFALALALGSMFCLIWWLKQGKNKFSHPTWMRVGLMAIFFGLLPMTVSMGWTAFADFLKSQNLLAMDLTSKALMQWNFGNLQQRIFGQLHHVPILVLFLGLMVVFMALLFLVKGLRPYFAAFFVTFFLGPMVFTNLYIEHTYYWYASAVYLYVALAFVAYKLIDKKGWSVWLRWCLIPVFLAFMVGVSVIRYLPSQLHDSGSAFVASAQKVQKYISSDGVILCYGLGWDSSFPYYAKRKALMVRGDPEIIDPALAKTIALTGPGNIQALVVGPFTSRDEKYLRTIASRFHLTEEISLSNGENMVTQSDIEKSWFDWNDVSSKLVRNGWAIRISSTELKLSSNLDSQKERMAQVFGKNFQGIYQVLEQSTHFIAFVRPSLRN